MKIVNLKEVPEQLTVLAGWHHAEWQQLNPGKSLNDRISNMQLYLNDNFIPSTYVAVNQKLLGSAAIIESDMDCRPELSPWLASVYVKNDERKKGVGAALVKHVMEEAAKNGVKKMYLYTPDQEAFYIGLGWYRLEKVNYQGVDVYIMKIDLY